MEIRNDKIKLLNEKFTQKYNLRASPARILELYRSGYSCSKISIRTGWELKDIDYVIEFMKK